jgi:hypothetical protein
LLPLGTLIRHPSESILDFFLYLVITRISNIESKAFILLCRQIIFSGFILVVDYVTRISNKLGCFSLFIFDLFEQNVPRIPHFLELLDMSLANGFFDEDICLFLPFNTEIWNQNLRYKDRLISLKLVDYLE